MQNLSDDQRKHIAIADGISARAEELRMLLIHARAPELYTKSLRLAELALGLRDDIIRKAGEQIVKKELGI